MILIYRIVNSIFPVKQHGIPAGNMLNQGWYMFFHYKFLGIENRRCLGCSQRCFMMPVIIEIMNCQVEEFTIQAGTEKEIIILNEKGGGIVTFIAMMYRSLI